MLCHCLFTPQMQNVCALDMVLHGVRVLIQEHHFLGLIIKVY